MANFQFLLLRPAHKCESSTQQLQQRGLNVIGLPLLRTEPLANAETSLQQSLSKLRVNDAIVAVSTVAAETATSALPTEQWPKAPVFAVGKSTAAILSKAGHDVKSPEKETTEGLLALTDFENVHSKSIVLLKGEGGRKTLAETLSARGAKVIECDLYRRVANQAPVPTRPWQAKDINAIIATSGELVDTAFQQLDADFLRAIPWLVVSHRVADIAKNHGVNTVFISQGAKDDDLLAAAKDVMEKTMVDETKPALTETSSPVAPAKPQPPGKQTNTGLWFFTLLNSLILIGVLAGAYWGWLQWQGLQTKQNAQIQTTLSDTQAQIDTQLQQQQQQLAGTLAPIDKEISSLKQVTELLNQQLSDVSGRRPSDWILAEADYLVRVAGRKLWLEKDIATAILMLESADFRLQDMADPSLLPVREKLAIDIAMLRQLKETQVTPIALKIGGLLQQVDSLPLVVVNLPSAPTDQPVVAINPDDSAWQRAWQSVTDVFDRMVEVHHRTVVQEPLLTEQQKWLVRQQLRHYLLQAQVALLKEQQAVYTQGIAMAIKTLDDYFDPATTPVLTTSDALKELAQVEFNQAFPQSLQSAELLRDVLERRLNAVFASTNLEVQP